MAEGARLESVYTATYRGFESPPHRHIRDESSYESTGFFLLYSPKGGIRTLKLPALFMPGGAAITRPTGIVGRVSAAPPDNMPAHKTKPGFPGLERNCTLSNTLAACAGRAPSARSHLW